MNVNERTKYPQLFSSTYWSGFDAETETAGVTEEIIENRNRFAEEWDVKQNERPWLFRYIVEMANTHFDHPELYRDGDGRILLLCSNYGLLPPQGLRMRKINPLYSDSCETFIRVFGSTKEFREDIKKYKIRVR